MLALRDKHPDLFNRAITMESGADLQTVKGLGRRFSWRALAQADAEQMKMFDDMIADDEPCGCYDGDYDGLHQTVVNLTTSAGCRSQKK